MEDKVVGNLSQVIPVIPEGDFVKACHMNRLHLPDDGLPAGKTDLGREHCTLIVP